ncbi:MAG: ferredoxin [Solirubrobacteraceae bacterium]
MSFKIILDEARCELHGECVVQAPQVFDIVDDDDDAVTMLIVEPDEGLRDAVQRAADDCPVQALRIEG